MLFFALDEDNLDYDPFSILSRDNEEDEDGQEADEETHFLVDTKAQSTKKRGKQRLWTTIARYPRVKAMEYLKPENLRVVHLSIGNVDRKGKKVVTHSLRCLEAGCNFMERLKILHRTDEGKENDTPATHEKSGDHNHQIGETTKQIRGMDEKTKDIIRSLKNVNPNGRGKAIMMLLDRTNLNENMQSNLLPKNLKQVIVTSFVILLCFLI